MRKRNLEAILEDTVRKGELTKSTKRQNNGEAERGRNRAAAQAGYSEYDDYDLDPWKREEEISTPILLRRLVKEKQEEVRRKTGKRLTQKMMAQELEVSEQTFSEWLRPDYDGKYRDTNLQRLADYFNVSIKYLKCEQVEKNGAVSEPEDPARVNSRNLEKYLETLGFTFVHGYGVNPDSFDPSEADPYFPVTDSWEKTIYTGTETDESGRPFERTYIDEYPVVTYPYGMPLMVTFPSGRRILLRENTFDAYCGDFAEWAGFILEKLLTYANREDVNAGTIPVEDIADTSD